MKKYIFACVMAVTVMFLAAVGLCVQSLFGVAAVSAFDDNLKIVVDAGHGGIDRGVCGSKTGVNESDLNLAVAFEAKEVFEEMGFEVTMTRKTSAGLYDTTAKGFKKRDMERRKEIIQAAKPDFIISVHQNAYPASVYRGGQVFYSGEEESKKWAGVTQSAFNALYAKEGAKGRKVMKGDFFLLRCYDCPAILVECGFLSNPKDEELLQTKAWQRKIAESLASGLVSYLSELSG